jgi:hypothetical protein
MRIAKGKDMKLKQVTFAEALEAMRAGGFAHKNPRSAKYRVESDKIQWEAADGTWCDTQSDLSHALNPWFVEVGPMRDEHQTTVAAGGYVPRYYIGLKWALSEVKVTVEEI